MGVDGIKKGGAPYLANVGFIYNWLIWLWFMGTKCNYHHSSLNGLQINLYLGGTLQDDGDSICVPCLGQKNSGLWPKSGKKNVPWFPGLVKMEFGKVHDDMGVSENVV